jgi:predicted Rossmann fold flavoprotein
MRKNDIAIIGGGASGLAAAIAAARVGAAVVILEKLSRVGKKLLATGNGRCNLGNLSQDPARYHGSVDTGPVFAQFPGEAALFRSLGLWLRPDEAGRLYPASGQATSVLDALRLSCDGLGVETRCDFAVQDIQAADGGFLLKSKNGDTVRARRVILAAGGSAGPQYGTDGAGFRLAERLGHAVTALYPALGPIPVSPQSVRALKGQRVEARVTAWRDGRSDIAPAEEGQVQFGEGALSGICVFNLAGYRPDALTLDLLPWCEGAAGLLAELAACRADMALEDFLTGILPMRVGQALLRACTDLPLTAPASALDARARAALTALLKGWRFPTLPSANWEAAQVTAGGVRGIAPTLESPLVPGLYFAGEILDVHGDTGGFNLRWAWASGSAAGTAAARGLSR